MSNILANDFFDGGIGDGFGFTLIDPASIPVGGFSPVVTVFYGAGAGLTPGGLYYLDAAGTWTPTNATAVGAGNDEKLAIAMGATPASGMMTLGWWNIPVAVLDGAFAIGRFIWMSAAGNFQVATVQPVVLGNISRCVGESTTVANVAYFNPAGVWATSKGP